MRRVIASLALVALAVAPVLAADIAKDPDVIYEGTFTSYSDHYGDRANALVVSVIEGVFTDLGPVYADALTSLGYSVDLIYDPMGTWPDMSGYEFVVVDHSDDWWGTGWLVDQDEAALAAYLDSGCGGLLMVGQDYLYFRGTNMGFPMDYMGVCDYIDDVNYADESMMYWDGAAGGPLEGLSDAMLPCFEANDWFTDDITPCTAGMAIWYTDVYPGAYGGGSAEQATGGSFSCVEFGCGNVVADVLDALIDFLGGGSPAEEASWSSVKAMFR